MGLYDLTPQVRSLVAKSGILNGQVLVFNRHTTTALAVNEFEPRLLEDIQNYLRRLAPPNRMYLHNDLDKRCNIPENEPRNAYAHLLALTLHTCWLSWMALAHAKFWCNSLVRGKRPPHCVAPLS